MIDLSSVCVKEQFDRLRRGRNPCLRRTVAREPLLGHGLLIELDVSLCEEAALGLITCEGGVIVISPWREFTGDLLNLREDERQEEVREDKMKKERKVKLIIRSRKSERTLNSCMTMGWNETQTS